MKYEEWIKVIDEVAKYNDKDKLELMKKQEFDSSINRLLEGKLENLVYFKLSKAIKKILRDIEIIFNDYNYLDMELVNFKKDINYILEICNLKQISDDVRYRLIDKVKNEVNKVYDILIREANRTDIVGVLGMTIKNNMIKWGD